MGRIYLVGVLFGGLSAFLIAPGMISGLVGEVGLISLGILWLWTGFMAYKNIRAGNVEIHREWMTAVLRSQPTRAPDKIEKRRQAMDKHTRDPLITGYDALIATLTLPDANDRHVIAAAIHGRCNVIVTFNLKHFPANTLASYGITAVHPDTFLLDLSVDDELAVLSCVNACRKRLKNPPKTADEHLAQLTKVGLPMLAARLAANKTLI